MAAVEFKLAAVEFKPGEFAGKYRQGSNERMRRGRKQSFSLQHFSLSKQQTSRPTSNPFFMLAMWFFALHAWLNALMVYKKL